MRPLCIPAAILVCVLWNVGCETEPVTTPGDDDPGFAAVGSRFVCEDPHGCIRLDQDGSFENAFSGHWTGDLDDSDQDETSARRVASITAIVDHDNADSTAAVTVTVRPFHSSRMLSFGTRDQWGVPRDVPQTIDISQHTVHISEKSRLVVQAAFNVMPGNERLGAGSGFDIAIEASRGGDVVAALGPNNFFPLPLPDGAERDSMTSTAEVWMIDWVELPLLPGVQSVVVTMRGLPEPRIVDHLFIDDVRIWLELNAPDTDLGLAMEANRNSAFVGEQVSFTITVTNLGTETARDVRITDFLPGELRYLSQFGDGVYNPITGVWDVDMGDATPTGVLLASFSASLTVTAIVTSLQVITIVNEARISDGLLGDFNADNDRASVPLHLNQAPSPEVTILSDLMNNGLSLPGRSVLVRADLPGVPTPSHVQWTITSVEGNGVYVVSSPGSDQTSIRFLNAGHFRIRVDVSDVGTGFSGAAEISIESTYAAFNFTVTATGVEATPQDVRFASRWELVRVRSDLTEESIAAQRIDPGAPGSENLGVDGLVRGERYLLRLFGNDPGRNDVMAEQAFVFP